MKVKKLRLLALEHFRAISGMNPEYIWDKFARNSNSERRQNEPVISARKIVTYDLKAQEY